MRRLFAALGLGLLVLASTGPTAVASDVAAYRAAIFHLERENSELRAKLQERDSARGKSYDAYEVAYYEQLRKLGQRHIAIYEWQDRASDWVLFLTVVVALAGIGFSGYQLWLGTRVAVNAMAAAPRPAPGSALEPGASPSPQGHVIDLVVEASKLQLKTSAIGLAVLIISCLYLYFFLTNVYKIDRVICETPSLVRAQKASEPKS